MPITETSPAGGSGPFYVWLSDMQDEKADEGFLKHGPFWDGTLPETRWLARPWLVANEIHTIIGNPGSGKSIFLLDTAVGLAIGGAIIFGAVQSDHTHRVLYFDSDSGSVQTAQRIGYLVGGRGYAVAPPELANLSVMVGQTVGFDTKEALACMVAAVNTVKPDVVMFDSLAGFTLKDECKRENISRIYRKILRPMAEEGRAIIVAHHERKTQAGVQHADFISAARGSGELAAAGLVAVYA